VTIPASVPQRSEIPGGLMKYPVLSNHYSIITPPPLMLISTVK
jgi:hypothetical protein